MHIFVKIGGIKGEERLNYLTTYLHCLPLILFARSIRPTFYFHPPIRGRGTYMAGTVKSVSLLKVGWKSVDFSSCTFDDPMSAN